MKWEMLEMKGKPVSAIHEILKVFKVTRVPARNNDLAFVIGVFLLLAVVFSVVLNIRLVYGSGTIYIRSDGSIDPSTAPISSVDNVTYKLTGNIYDSIVVERSNIVVDGAGYTVQGAFSGIGIDLSSRSNVIVKNTIITNFEYGIWLAGSSNNSIFENNIIANKWHGIRLYESSNNSISENNITANRAYGVRFHISSNNSISGNNMTSNQNGIYLSGSSDNSIVENNVTATRWFSMWITDFSNNNIIARNSMADNYYGMILLDGSNNRISGNNITTTSYHSIVFSSSSNNNIVGNTIINNNYGVELDDSSNNTIYGNSITNNHNGIRLQSSSNNEVYHNNFVGNSLQVYDCAWEESSVNPSINVWDSGYPSGGNYWGDYNGTDLYTGPHQNITGFDEIGDTPYIIDGNNQDRYPLMSPWPHDIAIINVVSSKTVVGGGYSTSISIALENQGSNTETFNVTLCVQNTTIITIQTQTFTLESGVCTIITFTWNTSGFANSNYTISVYAEPVLGELDTEDNTLVGGWVVVTILGDVNGDFKCEGKDNAIVAKAYDTRPEDSRWIANADINSDGRVEGKDVAWVAKYYDKSDP